MGEKLNKECCQLKVFNFASYMKIYFENKDDKEGIEYVEKQLETYVKENPKKSKKVITL